MEVSVRDFKAKLSSYLKDVRAGRDVVITMRGRPVARLLAISQHNAQMPDLAELLQRLRRIPGVQIAKGDKPRGASHPPRIGPGEKTLAQVVLADRR